MKEINKIQIYRKKNFAFLQTAVLTDRHGVVCYVVTTFRRNTMSLFTVKMEAEFPYETMVGTGALQVAEIRGTPQLSLIRNLHSALLFG